MSYTIVIGLEVHVQLLTESKMFCGCSTKFGAPPNTQTCPVCIGMPGTLPVMNRRAVELSVKAALALNCQIARFTKWDRKNYYYPDLPKGYQISQYDLPLSHDGWLRDQRSQGRASRPSGSASSAPTSKKTPARACTTKSAGKADSRIDLNRAGTPLLEIVSQPDMRSPAEAKAYLTELKLLLELPRRLRLQHAGRQPAGRCQHQPAHRHARGPRGHAHRRGQEHEQLPGRRTGDDLRGPAAISKSGRRPASGWARCPNRPAAGTKPRRPPTCSARRKNRAIIAISPSPTSCPSPPPTPRSSGSVRRWASCRPRSAAGWKRPTASRPTIATCW